MGEPLRPRPLSPVTAVRGLGLAGAGLRGVPAVAAVAAALAVAGDVARRAAMEAMESREGCGKSCCWLGVAMGAGLAGTGLVPVSQFRRGPVPVARGGLYLRYQ